MTSLVPSFVLEKYTTQQYDGHFPAVALFVDISGFSQVTNTLMQHGNEAAEVMADVMQAIFQPLVSAVYQYSGFITTFAGDAFTALFASQMESDPADLTAYRAALAAAIRIQRHISAHPTQDTPYGRFSFSVKLGIGDGAIDWGILQAAADSELLSDNSANTVYYFSGTAVNNAAAAEHFAQSGNLILAPAVYHKLTDDVKALPVDNSDGFFRVLALKSTLPEPGVGDIGTELSAVQQQAQTAFLPRTILDRTTYGEFRQVVSVFVNLMVDNQEQLNAFVQSVFTLQKRYGGYLNRVDFGDKGCNLLLFWGMPVSFEDDLERALNFLLDIPSITSATFKAGVTYRPMYAGLAGSPQRAEYTCYGDGVNLAARLMTSAPWGDIWLEETVVRRAGHLFTTEREETRTFKGFSESVPVYMLLERGQSDLADMYQSQFVGREDELAQLAAFVQPLTDLTIESRFAGLLLLQGGPGTGKTRLVGEFLQQQVPESNELDAAGTWQVFHCRTAQTVRRPLNPFRHWLTHYFKQSSTQSDVRNKRAFSRRLNQLIAATEDKETATELNRLRSCLGALVDLFWDNSLYAQLDPPGRYEMMITGLKLLIKAECLRQPVVLVLEDGQWLDEESLQFLQRLVRNMEAYPLGIIATVRPIPGQATSPLATIEGTRISLLSLSPLSSAALSDLAAAILGQPANPDLIALLDQRAEGNPFFAEQILLYLRDNGHLVLTDGFWHLIADRQQSSALPADISSIFTARLDNLAREVQDVVQTAAILGREFDLRVLSAMLNDRDIAEHVAAAEQADIWYSPDQTQYFFKQNLLRDAAYNMQLRARRREWHQTAAQTLEKLYTEALIPHYGAIAYHYEEACLQGMETARLQARVYLHKAGEQVAADHENETAVDYFTRALNLTLPDSSEGRYALLLAREEVYHLQGKRPDQLQDIEALTKIAEIGQRPQERAEVALRRARYANAIGDYELATQSAQTAFALAQSAQDITREATAQVQWGLALLHQGVYDDARSHLEQALPLADIAEQPRLKSESLRHLGSIARDQSDYATARDCFTQSLTLSQESRDRENEGRTLSNLGIVAWLEGSYIAAYDLWERSSLIFREIGGQQPEAAVLSNLGVGLSSFGDYVKASTSYERALVILRETGNRPIEGNILYNLGEVTNELGEFAQAKNYYEQSLAIRLDIKDRNGEGYTLHGLGIVALNQAEYEQAQDYFSRALVVRQELDQPQHIVEEQAGLALIACLQNNLEAAREYLAEVLTYIEDNPDLAGAERPFWVHLVCYQVLQRVNQDEKAQTVLERAYGLLQKRAEEIPEAETRRSFLENVPAHRALIAAYTGEEPAMPSVDLIAAPEKQETAAAEEPAPGFPDKADNLTDAAGQPQAASLPEKESVPAAAKTPLAAARLTQQPAGSKPKRSKTKKKKGKKKKSNKQSGKVVIHVHIHVENITVKKIENLNLNQSD